MLNKYLVNKLRLNTQPALVQHFKDIKLDSFMCSVERMCSLNNSRCIYFFLNWCYNGRFFCVDKSPLIHTSKKGQWLNKSYVENIFWDIGTHEWSQNVQNPLEPVLYLIHLSNLLDTEQTVAKEIFPTFSWVLNIKVENIVQATLQCGQSVVIALYIYVCFRAWFNVPFSWTIWFSYPLEGQN